MMGGDLDEGQGCTTARLFQADSTQMHCGNYEQYIENPDPEPIEKIQFDSEDSLIQV